MIEIVPAIDIIGGKCVRLSKGDFKSVKEYSANPVEMAKEFEKAGFRRLHVVDLDGAREGTPVNLEIVEKICRETNLVVDFGGGVKSEDLLKKVFDAGVSMVTGGSVAIRKKTEFLGWIKKYGAERIILGADTINGRVAIGGWMDVADQDLFSFIRFYAERGVKKVICTEVSRDGTMTGPDIALYKSILSEFPDIELIASGGVGSINDLMLLDNAGVQNVIVGKALYEGAIPTHPVNSPNLAKRIIPCLDVLDGRVVKGVNFVGLKDAGDPVELAGRYSDEGADELVFLDITASHEKRKTLSDLVRKVALSVNIPFTVGGGITSVDDVHAMLSNGADKVSVNSAAVRSPSLINELSGKFGSQCIVLAVDGRKEKGIHKVYLNGGRIRTDYDLFEWVKEAADRGAGEILYTSMDHDGTRNGYDNESLVRIGEVTGLPLIASGGAGEMHHFRDALTIGSADAALAAGVFHYGEITIGAVKRYLAMEGICVRE